MLLHKERILVLAPHTDDGELGAGASIAKWIEQGSRVKYVAFSSCQDSVPGGLPADILESEVKAATKTLGVASSDLHILDYKVRRFSERRQDILEDLVRIRREYNPDVILVPSGSDLHQDHSTVHVEAVRAFKQKTILCYEMPWNNITFTTTFFSVVEEEHVRRKAEALLCYQSQKSRPYFNEEFLMAQMTFRGVQVGARYAEVFELLRAVSN